MNKPSLITVVIPCYNQAHFLSEAIKSIQNQTYEHYEIIVVNDGSTDNTTEIARKFRDVQLIEQKNMGLAAARNAGLLQSNGEFVVFLDSDDRLLPNALKIGLEAFEQNPDCAFVSGFCRFISADGSRLPDLKQPRVKGEADHYEALLKKSYIWSPANVMYRRKIFEQTAPFDAAVSAAADYELYLRIARQFPVYQHGEIVAEYRKYNTSMSSNPKLMLATVLRVMEAQKQFVESNPSYKKAWRQGLGFYFLFYGKGIIRQTFHCAANLKFKNAAQNCSSLFDFFKTSLNIYRRSDTK
jgi:glycosyltransferase involved in cell wall biosynthesis